MYQCCIFDLDGTIINTIHSLAYSISLTMEHFGYEPIDEDHTKKFVGDGFKKLVERALIYSGDDKLSHYEEALAFYEETFEKNCLYKVEPYEGMTELLTFLKGKGIKIGVLTNKGHERAIECVEAVYGKGFNYRGRQWGQNETRSFGSLYDSRVFSCKAFGMSLLWRYQYRYEDRYQCRNGYGSCNLGFS